MLAMAVHQSVEPSANYSGVRILFQPSKSILVGPEPQKYISYSM